MRAIHPCQPSQPHLCVCRCPDFCLILPFGRETCINLHPFRDAWVKNCKHPPSSASLDNRTKRGCSKFFRMWKGPSLVGPPVVDIGSRPIVAIVATLQLPGSGIWAGCPAKWQKLGKSTNTDRSKIGVQRAS